MLRVAEVNRLARMSLEESFSDLWVEGELGDVKRQGDVLTYYGAMAYWEGRWDDAVELYERGRERSVRAGDAVGAAIA